MRGGRRQIQTAVLGGVDSEEPLLLPLEAIELDAFRRLHEHDTFWCGLLLGGCGVRLTTQLYTDRVRPFATRSVYSRSLKNRACPPADTPLQEAFSQVIASVKA
ncbi:hypothetical protein ABTX77_40455 [Streptomyces sp. NPDC097704]|uniref:hypothetical protein n=1 Tax=Streptomyces sp. NPDC097704 TaxID=3157101 RepID=UPI0033296E8D